MSARAWPPALKSGWYRYLGWLTALAVVTGLGYLGFRAYVGAGDLSGLNLYVIAVAAGLASFFSPCAFPLLPSYLSLAAVSGDGERAPGRVRRQPLGSGLSAALGVITFDLVLGLLIAALGTGVASGLGITSDQPNPYVRAFRGVLGAAVLVLGIGQLANWNLKPRLADALIYWTRPRHGSARGSAAELYFYGLGYTAAGMGCTGPILAGLVTLALGSGGFSTALLAFGVFALTMGGLMVLVSGLVANSNDMLIYRLKAAGPKVKNAAGGLLVLVGLFNLYFSLNLELFRRLLFP